MKIAIPTKGKTIKDKVASHFGRAKNFLIFDVKTGNFEIHQNPEAIGKAEFPPDFLSKLNVDIIICFSLGSRAVERCKKLGIKTKKAVKKTIVENIKLFQKDKLRNLEEKDIF